jgi:hypothetical protein
MKHTLQTPFKGTRHYIHGSDLFNTAQAIAECVTGVKGAYISKLAFTHFAYHLCELTLTEDEVDGAANKMGEGEFKYPYGKYQPFFLYEGAESPLDRTPYDEDGLVAAATYVDQAATLQAPLKYSSIEAVIALTKALNYRLTTPKMGKWVFGKIELTQALPAVQNYLTITRIKAVPGRFSINEINIDGVAIGTIQFIVGAP